MSINYTENNRGDLQELIKCHDPPHRPFRDIRNTIRIIFVLRYVHTIANVDKCTNISKS